MVLFLENRDKIINSCIKLKNIEVCLNYWIYHFIWNYSLNNFLFWNFYYYIKIRLLYFE